MTVQELNKELGNIDIYLLDQILKNSITKAMKVLDAGCGEGRNLVYLLNNGYDVFGVDANATAIKMLKMSANAHEPERFVETTIEEMMFPPNVFDYIISSAVLHFARDHDHFNAMIKAMVAVLKPKGTLFVRMTTGLGIDALTPTDSGVYKLPDGSQRYLFDIDNLDAFLTEHHLLLIEPIKSVVVHQQRSMGMMLFRKK